MSFTLESILQRGDLCIKLESRGLFGHNFWYFPRAYRLAKEAGKIDSFKEAVNRGLTREEGKTKYQFSKEIDINFNETLYLLNVYSFLGQNADSFFHEYEYLIQELGEEERRLAEISGQSVLDRKHFNNLLKQLAIGLLLYGVSPDELFSLYE